MSRFSLPLLLVTAFLLSGCGFGATTPIPTSTPTVGLFIRVPTPTPQPGVTASPTREPTIVISGTVIVPTETPTPTLTPTPTPTPVPLTVSELPDSAKYSWQEIITGLNSPEGLENAGDGSGRLFVVEQGGLIKVFKDGAILPTPFLDLTQKVNCCGERGLLGLAFHPDYPQNGYFYVDYTDKEGTQLYTTIARFQVSGSDPNVADPNSEQRLLHIEQPYQNHNGGEIQFGPDGYLYIGMGDGGSEGDPDGRGQSLDTLLGKILRIDVNGSQPYAIPADNPFANGGGLPEIWAYGLRNPWRFSFDRLNGDLYIGDVGQDAWEEVDYLPAGSPGGSNFGWNYYEGSHPYRGSPPAGATFVMPVVEYSHELGKAVTAGYVYRGIALESWYGVYLYSDYASGLVWGLLRLPDGSWRNMQMYDTGRNVSSFGEDENGEIYLVDYNGSVLKLQ